MLRSLLLTGICAALIGLFGPQSLCAQQKDGGQKAGQKTGDKAGEKAESKLPLCPVMGDPIDFATKTMTDDGPVYFCCKMCARKFKKQPEKYAAKIAEQRVMLAKMPHVQVSCPLSGDPIDQKSFTLSGGKKVYFCCDDCKVKYEAAPAKYAAKLAASYSYQTKCPVKGGDIDPAVFTELASGQRIYFCCPGCDKQVLKNPEKFAAKLAELGIKLDAKKMKAADAKPTP